MYLCCDILYLVRVVFVFAFCVRVLARLLTLNLVYRVLLAAFAGLHADRHEPVCGRGSGKTNIRNTNVVQCLLLHPIRCCVLLVFRACVF